jgi:hypothetical protein
MKVRIAAAGLFNEKRYDVIVSGHTLPVPDIAHLEYVLTDISKDGFCSLLSDKNEVREDLKLPGDVAETVREAFASAVDRNIYVNVIKVYLYVRSVVFMSIYVVLVLIIYVISDRRWDWRRSWGTKKKSKSFFETAPCVVVCVLGYYLICVTISYVLLFIFYCCSYCLLGWECLGSDA